MRGLYLIGSLEGRSRIWRRRESSPTVRLSTSCPRALEGFRPTRLELQASYVESKPVSAMAAYVTQPFTAANWTVTNLCSTSHNFRPVLRLSALDSSMDEITKRIAVHEDTGTPLIISDFHKTQHWNSEILSPAWIMQHHGRKSTSPLIYCVNSGLNFI